MPRFFVDTPLISAQALALPESVVRHIHVLRLKQGETVNLFDGRGRTFEATLTDIGKRHVTAHVGEALPDNGSEPPYCIDLVQGIASNEKMDWLIEKAVELGVHGIVPVSAARSVVRLTGERAQKRHAHWQALTQAACEQCGRARVPDVAMPTDFTRGLSHRPAVISETAKPTETAETVAATPVTGATTHEPLRLLLSPRGERRFADLPETAPAAGTVLLIGPEGGWSEEEESQALEAGFLPVSLGARVLRTETAGMALLAALASRWGGW
jgi:16S rRNA (uracil1498-N3)-methyltransferase